MKKVKLKDIANITAGQGAPQGETAYGTNGLPFVKAGHLNNLISGQSECELPKIAEDIASQHRLKQQPAGAIIFAKSGMSCMKGHIHQLREDCYVVSHLAVVIPQEKDLSDYLRHYFTFNRPNALIKDESYPSISLADIGNLEITLYPNDLRAQIVQQLDIITELICIRQQQLQKLDQLASSRFIEMFGNPATNPKGWLLANFDEFALIDAQMTTDYEKYADYPHIGIESIEKITGELTGYRTVKEDNVISGKYIFTADHIIYSKIRPNLNKVALPTFSGICSADAYPILPKENCSRIYLAFVMRSDYFLRYIIPLSGRSNMPKVNREQLRGFSMPLPPLELQNEFAAFIEQLDKSKVTIRKSIEKLETTYRALLQEYFG